jgi:hypothetical protein
MLPKHKIQYFFVGVFFKQPRFCLFCTSLSYLLSENVNHVQMSTAGRLSPLLQNAGQPQDPMAHLFILR